MMSEALDSFDRNFQDRLACTLRSSFSRAVERAYYDILLNIGEAGRVAACPGKEAWVVCFPLYTSISQKFRGFIVPIGKKPWEVDVSASTGVGMEASAFQLRVEGLVSSLKDGDRTNDSRLSADDFIRAEMESLGTRGPWWV